MGLSYEKSNKVKSVGGNPIDSGDWQYIAMTFDQFGSVVVYLNGEAYITANTSYTVDQVMNQTSSSCNIHIGCTPEVLTAQ